MSSHPLFLWPPVGASDAPYTGQAGGLSRSRVKERGARGSELQNLSGATRLGVAKGLQESLLSSLQCHSWKLWGFPRGQHSTGLCA